MEIHAFFNNIFSLRGIGFDLPTLLKQPCLGSLVLPNLFRSVIDHCPIPKIGMSNHNWYKAVGSILELCFASKLVAQTHNLCLNSGKLVENSGTFSEVLLGSLFACWR